MACVMAQCFVYQQRMYWRNGNMCGWRKQYQQLALWQRGVMTVAFGMWRRGGCRNISACGVAMAVA